MNQTQNHRKIKPLLALIPLLLVLLCSCSGSCTKSDLSPLLDQVEELSDSFNDLTNETANHPELKAENVEEMNLMLDDFAGTKYPHCAKNLTKLVQEAMESSITYIDPPENTYYYPYQLAKFAMDDWQAVEDEVIRIKDSFSKE